MDVFCETPGLPGALQVTVVPVEAFVLTLDLDPLSFESLGNDQNYQESIRDQNGETQFRFRYSLRAHTGGWKGAAAANFSRGVTSPPIAAAGATSVLQLLPLPQVDVDRALVTSFKPADDLKTGGHILRIWERAGESGPLKIAVPGYHRAVRADLLERDKAELEIANGEVTIQLAGHGFTCLRLFPA